MFLHLVEELEPCSASFHLSDIDHRAAKLSEFGAFNVFRRSMRVQIFNDHCQCPQQSLLRISNCEISRLPVSFSASEMVPLTMQ